MKSGIRIRTCIKKALDQQSFRQVIKKSCRQLSSGIGGHNILFSDVLMQRLATVLKHRWAQNSIQRCSYAQVSDCPQTQVGTIFYLAMFLCISWQLSSGQVGMKFYLAMFLCIGGHNILQSNILRHRWTRYPLQRYHRRRIYTEEKAKVVAAVWGAELIKFRFRARMIGRNGLIEKFTFGGMDASEQLDDIPVHTTPNHHPPKMDVLPKLFFNHPCC